MSASELDAKVRAILEKEFDTQLFKDHIQISVKSDGQPKTHQFDIASPDRKIVGEVKLLCGAIVYV